MAKALSPRPTSLPNRQLLIVALALIAFASGLGIVAAGDNILTWDARVSSRIQQWQGDVPAALHHIGDMLGDTVPTAIILLALIAMAATAKSKRFAAFFIAVGLLRLTGMALKKMFDSPRPVESGQTIRIYETFEGTGYPSGHSMTAAMFAMLLVTVTWSLNSDRKARWIAVAFATFIMVFIGWSRIWSGAHWPTDVIGGWSFGTALVLIAWVITTPFADSQIEQASEPAPE